MPVTLEWRLSDVTGQPGPINTVVGPDGSGAITLLPSDTDVQVRAAGDSTWTSLRTLPAQVDPDSIPVVRESFGGRQNVVPARFYTEGQDELIDPATHPMPKGTFNVHAGGLASDASKWSLGRLPVAGESISIAPNAGLIWDLFSDVIYKDVLVPMGTVFTVATWMPTRMRMDYFMSMGVVNITDTNPTGHAAGQPRHEFIFHASEAPGATTRLGAMFMGPLRRRGATKKNHMKVGIPSGETVPMVRAGATEVRIPGLADAGWQIGHVIMIGGTQHVPLAATDPQYEGPTSFYMASAPVNKTVNMNAFQFGQEEQRTITGFNGEYVQFAEPLQYDHIGLTRTLPQGQSVTISPVVGNPCHSIQFRSASAAEDGHLDAGADLTDLQKRAHVMAHRCESVDDRYISHKSMARTDTNPTLWVAEYTTAHALANPGPLTVSSSNNTTIANPNNVRGHYAMHYHWCGGPYLGAPLIYCVGITAWAPLNEYPVPGWAITQHGTRMAIHDAFVINVRGAGIVSELGNELGQWVNNCVMGVRGDGETTEYGNRAEALTNHNDSAGHAFGNQSRAIIMHDNIAISAKYCYVWHKQGTYMASRALRMIDVPFKDAVNKNTTTVSNTALDEGMGHHTVQIPPFINNIAIASNIGIFVVHRLSSMPLINGRDNTPMLIEDFHCLNVVQPFSIPQYSNSYYLKNCLWKRPTFGGSAANLGNVTWNWNFSNMRLIDYATQFQNSGAGLNYGGFWFDIEYEGGGQFTNVFTTTDTSVLSHNSWNVMGDAETSGPNGIVPRRWRSRTAADLPLPYPLAPYGYGGVLPAGYEPVEPGEAPYFILGNGVNQTDLNLTLAAGSGRGQGRIHGIVVDSVGMMRWPDWQSSESYPSNLSIKNRRDLDKMQPEQLVQTWGCWNDNGTWKARAWWFIADRYTHVESTFHIDFTLTGFSAAFLALHDLGAPSTSPEWPKLEQVLPPPPLSPIEKDMSFLSRTTVEVVSGQTITHRLRYTAVAAKVTIVGGADAALFRISMGQLQWTGGGTRNYASGGQNTYSVTVRVEDVWGNSVDATHQVTVLDTVRRVSSIADNFTRANQTLETNPAYVMLRGAAGTFTIVSDRPQSTLAPATPSIIDLGQLTSTDLEMYFGPGENSTRLLFRMVDADNWMAIKRSSGNTWTLEACINGTISTLGEFPHVNYYHKLTVRGRRVDMVELTFSDSPREPVGRYPKTFGQLTPLELTPLDQAGVVLLPEGLPMGTKVGFGTGASAGILPHFLTVNALA